MERSRKATLALLAITALTAGCGKKPPPPVAAPDQGTPTAQRGPSDGAGDRGPSAEEVRRAEERRIRAILEEMVFFDYDQARIRDDARARLDQKVPALREHNGFSLSIEGHADERGSTEYNLALGMRRAVSVRDYLVGFGLDPARFRVQSYGEERPLAQGHDESAWSRNRRAEFVVGGGMANETDGGR